MHHQVPDMRAFVAQCRQQHTNGTDIASDDTRFANENNDPNTAQSPPINNNNNNSHSSLGLSKNSTNNNANEALQASQYLTILYYCI